MVDNVGDGFNLYKLDTGVFIKTLITKDPIKTHPKGVAFASQSLFIVGGSDHGLAYVFDRKTGDIVTTFHYASVGGAETIAVCLFFYCFPKLQAQPHYRLVIPMMEKCSLAWHQLHRRALL